MFAQSQDYTEADGNVVAVHDADTYKIQINGEIVTLRLAGVDCPELKQSYGVAARDSVRKTILNKNVKVRIGKKKTDAFGRSLGVVLVNNVFVDSLIVASGWGWFYKEFPIKYGKANQELENIAKSKLAGLWNCKTAIPPKLFRLFNAQTKLLYGTCE